MLIDIPLISIFDNNTSRERKINFSPLFAHVKRTQRMRFVKPRLREHLKIRIAELVITLRNRWSTSVYKLATIVSRLLGIVEE